MAFKGKVRQMLRHSEASSVVEYAYNDKAVLSQRLMLTEELYGNTFQVCKVAIFSGFSLPNPPPRLDLFHVPVAYGSWFRVN